MTQKKIRKKGNIYISRGELKKSKLVERWCKAKVFKGLIRRRKRTNVRCKHQSDNDIINDNTRVVNLFLCPKESEPPPPIVKMRVHLGNKNRSTKRAK